MTALGPICSDYVGKVVEISDGLATYLNELLL